MVRVMPFLQRWAMLHDCRSHSNSAEVEVRMIGGNFRVVIMVFYFVGVVFFGGGCWRMVVLCLFEVIGKW